MAKFTVSVTETQYWTYQYEVEADNDEAAQLLGVQQFFDGEEATDSWLDDSNVTEITTKLEVENA